MTGQEMYTDKTEEVLRKKISDLSNGNFEN